MGTLSQVLEHTEWRLKAENRHEHMPHEIIFQFFVFCPARLPAVRLDKP
jgi:hypothetical protein